LRRFFWKILRAILFRIDAETAHRITLSLIRLSIRLGNVPLRIAAGGGGAKARSARQEFGRQVFGMTFSSPVGLAAGFDKDAEILTALPDLGFGFAEIGTVTPRPQPGNERPRLFRDPSRSSLFNRMGFNGLGAALVSRQLAEKRSHLPEDFRVGVNIGKNKDTPLERAAEDYRKAIAPFRGLADYVVINVSSPNTPGLRSLQTVQALRPIVSEVREELSGWQKMPPLLLKLAPEVRGEELRELVEALEKQGISGWVLTNTLGGEIETASGKLTGGWSGGALTEGSRLSLQAVRAASRLPIISVGGILTVEEAALRLQLGADLVQIYSGWIYKGPSFPREIQASLKA
jgi:dihydroorotate dehydrogenase